MKETALKRKHEELGAKMVPFAGFNMPVYYSGIKDEHLAVRNSAGIFDVSHMGEFLVSGKRAFELLQFIASNDISRLEPGKAQYNCMPNDKGGIVDDLIIYNLEENNYMMVVNAANIDKDWEWVNKQNQNFHAQLENISYETTLIAVQGPRATELLQKLTDIDLNTIGFYRFTTGSIAGADDVIISGTGYTGSGGFELYCNNRDAEIVWDHVMDAGMPYNIKPAGLGARDTLRIEAGLALYGNDIDGDTSPLEARLGWITKFTKQFIAKDLLEKQKEEGVQRKLVGLVMNSRGIPRKDFEITDMNEELVGTVTSGTMSPILEKPIAMGYVKKGYTKPGTQLKVKLRNKFAEGEVIKLPFYKKQ